MIKKAAAGYVGWLCANGIVAPEKNKYTPTGWSWFYLAWSMSCLSC